MNEYTAGDLVEAVKGETVIRGRLKDDNQYLWVGDLGRTTGNLESYGFTLSIIEKAAAVVVLPAEKGVYKDDDGDLWRFTSSGWKCLETESGSIHDPETYAPFTRLEPVSETAKKVLDRVGEVWPLYNLAALDDIADDFGVEL